MADLARVRVVWTGAGVVGGGVSTFYSSGSGAGLTTAVKNWFTAISNLFPAAVGWEFPTSGDTIDSATGGFVTAWTGGPGGTVLGSATVPQFAMGVGVRAVWDTATVSNRRRVRGATYLVPLSAGLYGADGTIDNAIVTDLTTKTNAFRTAATSAWGVWTRPSVKGASDGGFASITGSRIPDKVTWLTTRRT